MTATTAITTTYATPLQLASYLAIESTVPDIGDAGSARSRENVGTGDNSNTLFFLDNAFVINGSYILSSGATESAATTLTEILDFTIDIDKGNITLTAAGVTAVGTDVIFAEYSFVRISLTNTQLQDALDRAQRDVDIRTNNHFAVSTDVTPDWIQNAEEIQDGKGFYDRGYYADNLPTPDVKTTLTAAAGTATTTIAVSSTNGFLVSGTLTLGSDKVTYTGKNSGGTAFTGGTGITETHAVGVVVDSFVVEISTTQSGTEPAYVTLTKDSDYDFDIETGRVHLYRDGFVPLSILDRDSPPRLLPNRFRVSYLSGESTIPADITRLTLMIASTDLMHMAVRKAVMDGNNDFKPRIINVDERWIDMTVDRYRNHDSRNT